MNGHDYWWNFKGKALCACGADLEVKTGRRPTDAMVASADAALAHHQSSERGSV